MKKLILASILSFLIIPAFAAGAEVPLMNSSATVSSAGATARTQLASRSVSYCTIQARPANAGAVYVGGYTVTNASGANPGIVLAPGGSYASIRVNNSNEIYIAADNSGDKVNYACN